MCIRDSILAEGQPVGSFWGVPYEGVDPETGDPIYTDTNGDGIIDDDDAVIIGKATPAVSYTHLTLPTSDLV